MSQFPEHKVASVDVLFYPNNKQNPKMSSLQWYKTEKSRNSLHLRSWNQENVWNFCLENGDAMIIVPLHAMFWSM